MRTGLPTLLLALSPCFISASVLAQEARDPIVVLDQQLFDKHEELKAATRARDEQNAKFEEQQQVVAQLTKLAKSLDETLNEAKTSLENDYSRMIEDPNIDLAATQKSTKTLGQK